MKVKIKLFLSLLFLFGVIILLGCMGSYYLRLLAEDSSAIMKDNNRTLNYMRQIDELVDEIFYQRVTEKDTTGIKAHLNSLEEIMAFQLVNITEPGELELTEKLNRSLQKLKALAYVPQGFASDDLLRLVYQIRQQTGSIYLINEQTMTRKSEQAAATADKVVLYMGIFVSASVITGLVFIIGLPIYISRPLETFNNAIRQVAGGNYKVSIPESTKDEFGQLANYLNTMAVKLNEY
jgi:two-component system, NtrC family, sensor histidine kinase KinB